MKASETKLQPIIEGTKQYVAVMVICFCGCQLWFLLQRVQG